MDNIIIKNISFSYSTAAQAIISDFSLTVAAGERLAIMAPSGRGKTTVLHLLSGILQPNSGEIIIPESSKISMVFQEDRLIEQISVKKNLLLTAGDKNTLSMDNLLTELGLSGYLCKKAKALSGGEKRRVSIARALISPHDILLMDEPFTGLDESSKKNVMDIVKKYSENKTLILVTHEEKEAKYLGCKIIEL